MGSNLLIRNTQSPGDIVVLSAAIRDMHLCHPNKFDTSVCVSPGAEHIFQHNPYISKAWPAPGRGARGKQFVAHYPLITRCNQERKHFLWGFIEHMNKKLHTNIKLTDFRPDLHISEQEIARPLIQPPYWLFLSGGKTDFRTKIWSRQYWQQLIASTKNDIKWVQCGGGSKNHIMHEKIAGVHEYMVKKTKLREFIRLIYHADGVVCVVTAAMHIAAAFNKPCVVIAGGREPWWWEAYTNENRLFNMRVGQPHWQIPPNDDYVEHRFLHTMNQLPCCRGKGCWKSKLTKSSSKCMNVVEVAGQRLPKCKAMIKPEMVAEAIFSYYEDGVIGKKKVMNHGHHVSSVFGIFPAGDDRWKSKIVELLPADDVRDYAQAGSRLEAIKAAIAEEKDWLFWFEPGGMPTTNQWLNVLKSRLSTSGVSGRIYRTADGKLYPHPSCFICPTKVLNKDATTYVELFSNLARTQFVPLGSEVELQARRPCLSSSGEPADQPAKSEK